MHRSAPRIAPLVAAALLLGPHAAAQAPAWTPPGWEEARAARPDLFHPESGLRIARQRAPTPRDIPPPARVVEAEEARALIAAGAVAVDVGAAFSPRYDELTGDWPEPGPHDNIPGAVWLPETGRGVLSDEISTWYAAELRRLTGGDMDRPLVIFCIADCWMSWNAARRAGESLGHRAVFWFRLGVDGWLDAGFSTAPVPPTPVTVD